MYFKQLTVFIENEPGTLQKALEVLADAQMNILSVNLTDTADFGLMRLLLPDPEGARDILNQAGYSAILSDVFLVRIPQETGTLLQLIRDTSALGVNLDYMYNLTLDEDSAYIILKFSNAQLAARLLKEKGVEMIGLARFAE